MQEDGYVQQLLLKIEQLESRLEESEQLIEAIKAGEVDAFAINKESKSEIYTLQTGDYVYRLLIEEFGEGAINITEEGLIVYTNASFFELLQLPYEKVIGKFISEFVHPDSTKEFNMLLEKALTGKSKGEINLVVSGNIIPVYISLTSLQPSLATVGIIITDLSEKKKNEKIIQDYQHDLEYKNLELVKSNADLASFAYIASHDLQEPLRKIQTFIGRILENDYDKISDKGREHFSRTQNAARRMQILIEDLLTYSRTNTLERRFETVDIFKIIEEVKADLTEELQQKQAKIEIEVQETCLIRVITFQFRQLLYNLISNSLKFSIERKIPVITIKSETVSDIQFENKLAKPIKYCHISITDNGIGFEQEYSEKIFDLFQRLHSNLQYTGTGIGLAIVKKIVENHDGFITAYSKTGHGATFNIYIPSF